MYIFIWIFLWLIQSRYIWTSRTWLSFWRVLKLILRWITGYCELDRMCAEWSSELNDRIINAKETNIDIKSQLLSFVPSEPYKSKTFGRIFGIFSWMRRPTSSTIAYIKQSIENCQMIPVSPLMLWRIEKSVYLSKKLTLARYQLESKNTFNIKPSYQMFLEAKPLRYPLSQSLFFQAIMCQHVSYRLSHFLDSKADTKYDSSSKSHEKRLMDLWSLLIDDKLVHRHSKQWERLGFQGTDPATDFRGMGIFGLEALWYFAKRYNVTARKSVLSYSRESRYLPWACVGLQVLSNILSMIRRRECQYYLYDCLVINSAQFGRKWWESGQTTGLDRKAWEDGLGSDILTDMKESVLELFCFLFVEFDTFFDDYLMTQSKKLPSFKKVPQAVAVFPEAFEKFKNHIDYRFRCFWDTELLINHSLVKQKLMENKDTQY